MSVRPAPHHFNIHDDYYMTAGRSDQEQPSTGGTAFTLIHPVHTTGGPGWLVHLSWQHERGTGLCLRGDGSFTLFGTGTTWGILPVGRRRHAVRE